MANVKISELDPADALAGTEVFAAVQDGATVAPTIDQVIDYAKTEISASDVGAIPAVSVGTLAATGSNQAGAALITNRWTVVTGASGGVRLPPLVAGDEYHIHIRNAGSIYVYPASGETLLGLAANTGQVLHWTNTLIIRCRETGIGERHYVSNSTSSSGNVVALLGSGTTGQPAWYHDMTTGQAFIYGVALNLIAPSTSLNLPGPSSTTQVIVSDVAGAVNIKPRGLQGLRVTGVASAVNYIELVNAATGNTVEIKAVGTDTDVDLKLTPQAAGNVRFGAHSAVGAETVTGYITIKDAGGTTRKLAVIS